MQALNFAAQVLHLRREDATACALGVPGEVSCEADAFQFNPNAAEFLLSGNMLPARAQVIEDIYHEWDTNAVAWQGESRVAHFMTWYVAPGIGRLQCLYGRRIALMADFWNWREQFRRKWIDEIDQRAEIELIQVSPPPTLFEAGIAGHVILVQHNSVEWSSLLVSVFDPAINNGHPFRMVHSFHERLFLQEVVVRIGYNVDCEHHAQCSFRIRGQHFQNSDQVRASDGDAIDLTVDRFYRPHDRNRLFIPHHPGAEGLSLLQISQKKRQTWPQVTTGEVTGREQQLGVSISIPSELQKDVSDIDDIPFTLAIILNNPDTDTAKLAICAWEINGGGTETEMHQIDGFDPNQRRQEFQQKQNLLKKNSALFNVKFSRLKWKIKPEQWLIGSFVQPKPDYVIIAGIEYSKDGAIARTVTIPRKCRTDALRSMLNICFGTKVRLNGEYVLEEAEMQSGDVLEYHVATACTGMILDRHSVGVQICLDAALVHTTPHFDVDNEAFEVLQFPEISSTLSQEDAWAFQCLPEGINLHRESFEALYQQSITEGGRSHAYELYIDGATASDSSAWAVVAVAVSDSERRFLGCLGGLTEIDRGSHKWIGANQHANIDAELSAMVVATAFAFFGSEEVQFVIRPDLALSRKFLSLQSNTRQDSVIAKVLHVLGESMPSNIAMEVRAHCGNPWNELADAVACSGQAHCK